MQNRLTSTFVLSLPSHQNTTHPRTLSVLFVGWYFTMKMVDREEEFQLGGYFLSPIKQPWNFKKHHSAVEKMILHFLFVHTIINKNNNNNIIIIIVIINNALKGTEGEAEMYGEWGGAGKWRREEQRRERKKGKEEETLEWFDGTNYFDLFFPLNFHWSMGLRVQTDVQKHVHTLAHAHWYARTCTYICTNFCLNFTCKIQAKVLVSTHAYKHANACIYRTRTHTYAYTHKYKHKRTRMLTFVCKI